VDGRHKAGHDDSGVERVKPTMKTMGARLLPTSDPLIVMAGLVPAIHGFLSLLDLQLPTLS
jgi:hypothetical protein